MSQFQALVIYLLVSPCERMCQFELMVILDDIIQLTCVCCSFEKGGGKSFAFQFVISSCETMRFGRLTNSLFRASVHFPDLLNYGTSPSTMHASTRLLSTFMLLRNKKCGKWTFFCRWRKKLLIAKAKKKSEKGISFIFLLFFSKNRFRELRFIRKKSEKEREKIPFISTKRNLLQRLAALCSLFTWRLIWTLSQLKENVSNG